LFALNVVRNKIAWTVDFQETAKAKGLVAGLRLPSFFDALYQHIIVFSIWEV